MKTTTVLLGLSTMLLFACSGADDASGQAAPPGSQAAAPQTPNDASTLPCPVSPDAGAPPLPAPAAVTPSPAVKCQGYYRASLYGEQWMHRTAKGCVIGSGSFVIHEDGSAEVGSAGPGRVEGDEFYFKLVPNDSSQNTIEWIRLPAEPSK